MSLIPRELHGDDKLMCNGLKCIFYNIFKKTLKQDDENSHISVPFSVASQLTLSALSNFMAVYACSFTGYLLQYNWKGHWKVKIISIAAEGT